MRVIRRSPAILGDRVFQDFARSLQAADLAEATRRGYLRRPRPLPRLDRRQTRRRRPLRQINTLDLTNYRQHLIRTEKLRAASVNRKVQALKKFFGWAQHKKLVSVNPAAALRFLRRQERAQPRGLHEEEIQALLRAAGQTGHGLARRNYALLQLLLQTGLRVGEVSRLAIADCEINDRSGMVRVRAGKGGKEREVPLNASARRALAQYLKTREDYDRRAPISKRARRPSHVLADRTGNHPRTGAPCQDHACAGLRPHLAAQFRFGLPAAQSRKARGIRYAARTRIAGHHGDLPAALGRRIGTRGRGGRR